MSFISKALLFLSVTVAVQAQTTINPATQVRWPAITGAGTPTSLTIACTSVNYGQPFQDTAVTPNTFYTCGTDGWVVRGGSGSVVYPGAGVANSSGTAWNTSYGTGNLIPGNFLSLFGASGTNHAIGAVPDPGNVAGTTRFLREDQTWSVPGGTTTNTLTAAATGGAAPGMTFNGSAAVTFDYHSFGAQANLSLLPGTYVNGDLCTYAATGTLLNCNTAPSGTGTVTSVAVGTWPSWLTPTVTNATTTPSIAVAASAIPNAALAHSSTTVNGQTCALGGSCTIATGGASITVNGGTALTSPVNLENSTGAGGITISNPSASNVQATLAASGVTAATYGSVTTVPVITVNAAGQVTAASNVTATFAPPADYIFYPAAISSGGSAYASGCATYTNNQPQLGSVNPNNSSLGYLAFQYEATLPQYCEFTRTEPPYWTGTSLTLDFFSSLTSGNVTWEVQSSCIPAAAALNSTYSPTFNTPVLLNTAVSTTAYGLVTTATATNVALPGSGNCPASSATPVQVTYRFHRIPGWNSTAAYVIGNNVSVAGVNYVAIAASTNQTPPNATYWSVTSSSGDSANANANMVGVTLAVGRSQ